MTFLLGLGAGGLFAPGVIGRSVVSITPAVALPSPNPVAAPRAAYPAEVLRVLDGDTFEARVRVWPGHEVTTRVRLRGIDAPEMKARCGVEYDKAVAARNALQSILDQGYVGITAVTLDKYGGRVLAEASTQAIPDVSAALLQRGVVRPYSGARREGWCD